MGFENIYAGPEETISTLIFFSKLVEDLVLLILASGSIDIILWILALFGTS